MEYNKVTNSELKNISRGYGMKMHPIKKIMKKHSGIDIPVSTGHDIYAIADGTIVDSEIRKNACGGTIKVDHGVIDGKKIETRFCHCSQLLKQKGDEVKKGDIIAKSGGGKGDVGQGGSTGSHIHFEVYENGKTVDPMKYYTGGQNFQSQNSANPITNNSDSSSISGKSDNDILSLLKSVQGKSTSSPQMELLKPLLSSIGLGSLIDILGKSGMDKSSLDKLVGSVKESEEIKVNYITEEIKRIKQLMK